MINKITKSQIKSIGKRLRSISLDEDLNSQDLQYLNEWRLYHDSSLRYYASVLKAELLEMNLEGGQFYVIQRLKRIYSMIVKLKRYPQMQLSMMEDIAGARVVVPSVSDVNELVERLRVRKSKHEIIKINNYVSRPKPDGYRSTHVIYKIKKEPDIFIEVQIRSDLQHIWATGVEVFGTLINTSFKTGEGEEEWKEFFALLSSYFSLKEGASIVETHELYSKQKIRSLLIEKIRTLNIIEQLEAYTSVYTSQWRKNRPKGRSGKFALLILNTIKNKTEVKFYAENKLSEALRDYSEIEKKHHSDEEINAVLVNLDDMEKLETAYPNYFMNTKSLSAYLSKIVLNKF